MSALDNFDLLAALVPETFDGDTYYCTELLDRSKRSGNNQNRRVATYTHRTRQNLLDQRDQIIKMCEVTGARAYFRPTPRSFSQVGRQVARHIVDQAVTNNWEGMRHAWAHVAGITPGRPRRWVWDVDRTTTHHIDDAIRRHESFVMEVPSRKGWHFITLGMDISEVGGWTDVARAEPALRLVDIAVHKNNPTNLYIPESAA